MWAVFAQQQKIIAQLLGKSPVRVGCWAFLPVLGKIFRPDIGVYRCQNLPNKIEFCNSELELSLLTKLGKGN